MMEKEEVHDMFLNCNRKYFWGKLNKVKLNWSKRMTLCAGKTYCKERQGNYICSIYLSEPLLSQRPPDDTTNTLLHEMIHAYLFVTEGRNYKMGHGPQFKEHMHRINKLHGSKITVCHNFTKEVDQFRVHVYRCDGPCTKKRPYFGVIRRAITRPPGPTDRWWTRHSQECGGTFRKVEGPDISPSITPPAQKPARPTTSTAPPKYTSSRKMDPARTPSSGAPASSGRRDRKLMSDGRSLASVQEKNTGNATLGEDQLIHKIKRRHAHASRSILLSNKQTKMKWRGSSPEHGTLVEGHVNYNYKIKSGFKFNINKYLERYRATKEAEARTHHKNERFQSPLASLDSQKVLKEQATRPHASTKEATRVPPAARDAVPYTSVNLKTGGSSHAAVPPVVCCWNCGVNVMVPQHAQNSQNRQEQSTNDIPKSIPPATKECLGKNASLTLVECPSCKSKVPQEELNSHLDECLMPFTDEF